MLSLRRIVSTLRSGSVLTSRACTNPVVSLRRNQTTPPNNVVEQKRGLDREPLRLRVGDQLHGYVVKEVRPVPERNLTAVRLEHEATGAEHLHLDCADTNNVFSVTFKTVPKDSTGVAHILEHTTLCGSRKYPVRDPFFNMLRRSLNTYMNAWTGADQTTYPFATQNAKDYDNLMSVYLDATFFPTLDKIDFMQEGHRLEFEKPEDPRSGLVYKGVVYNEMKGSMSDPTNLFLHRLTEALYPADTYHFNSGGEPSDIPNLTYEQLKEFHRVHYHPSNARFFTYGDLPLASHLRFIQKNALREFERTRPDTSIGDQPRLPPRRIELTCPPAPLGADPERTTKMCTAVLASNITDTFEAFTLSIISSLLLHGPNAPMHQRLIESNIGLSYAPGTGYDANAKESSFGIGLQGIRPDDVPEVERVINEVLEQVAHEGFPAEQIESVLHQIELGQKHVTANFGMSVLGGTTSPWVHGGDPVAPIEVNKQIARFREELAKGPFLQQKVRQYLIDNQHRVTLVMHEDAGYMQHEAEDERRRLREQGRALTDEKKREIIELAKELKRRQEAKPDVSVLPTLRVSDIPAAVPFSAKLDWQDTRGIPVAWSAQPTNGLVYFRTVTEIPQLPAELAPYLPLFCQVLTQMGTAKRDHRELAHKIELHTGGISVRTQLLKDPHDLRTVTGYVELSSWALERNTLPMFELLHEVASVPRFDDQELLRTHIAQHVAGLQDSIISQGHSFASTFAAAPFRIDSRLHEEWAGVSHVAFMQRLVQQDDLSDVVEKLQQISRHVLGHAVSKCLVTAEERGFAAAQRGLDALLSGLPSSPASSNIARAPFAPSPLTRTYIAVPGAVNYVAKCLPTVPWSHPDDPKLQVAAKLLSSNYLHREVREKGGAYGGGLSYNSGSLSFYSYRDPHVTATLDAFQASAQWAVRSEFSDQDIEEAKISIFGDLDAPLSPSRLASHEFHRALTGITLALRQERRDRLFAVSRQDIVDVTRRYLLDRDSAASVCVLGSEQNTQFKTDPTWQYRTE